MLWNYNYIYKKWSPLQKVFQCYLFTFMVNKKGDSFCGYEFDILYTYVINLWSPFFILTIEEIWKCYDSSWNNDFYSDFWDTYFIIESSVAYGEIIRNFGHPVLPQCHIHLFLNHFLIRFYLSLPICRNNVIFFSKCQYLSQLHALVFLSQQRHFNAYLKINSQVSYQKLIVYNLS